MILYIDCIGGISGDMFLSALLDVGVPRKTIEESITTLGLKGWKINVGRAKRGVISGRRVNVIVKGDQPHRKWTDIKRMIESSALDNGIKKRALKIFRELARAEASVHGEPVGKVHFHEVGAIDSIVDIVGAAAGLEWLGVKKVFCSTVPLGKGTISCAHGVIPLPAPATLKLLEGFETRGVNITGETCTPTGAAILRATAESSNIFPSMTVERVGYGAGKSVWKNSPNLLRLIVGKENRETAVDDAAIIEANIDDMPPQDFEPLMEAAFEAGALDVTFTSAQMKKNRPGTLVRVLAPKNDVSPVVDAVLKHSSTLGARWYPVNRRILKRKETSIKTEYGKIRAKRTELPGKGVRLTPEYDDLRRASIKANVPIEEIRKAFWVCAGKK